MMHVLFIEWQDVTGAMYFTRYAQDADTQEEAIDQALAVLTALDRITPGTSIRRIEVTAEEHLTLHRVVRRRIPTFERDGS